MNRDIDLVIERVRSTHPDVEIEQLKVTHPADDDGIWFFKLAGANDDIHVESSTGAAPFSIAHCGMRTSAEVIFDASIDQTVSEVVSYLSLLKRRGPDERKIRELHSTWIGAVNAGNLEKLLTLMTDDVVYLNPSHMPMDRGGFASAFSASLERIQFNCVSELEEVTVVGDVAYTRSRDSLSVTSRAGGETTQFAGYRMTIYRKQPDGRWLLARDIHTVSPVQK